MAGALPIEPDETIQDALEKLRDRRDLLAQQVNDLLREIDVRLPHIVKLDKAIGALTEIVEPAGDEALESGAADEDPDVEALADIVERARTYRPVSSQPVSDPPKPPAAPQEAAEASEGDPGGPRLVSLKRRILSAILEARDGLSFADLVQRFPEAKVPTIRAYLSQFSTDGDIIPKADRYLSKESARQREAA